MHGQAFAQQKKLSEPKLVAHLRAGAPADDGGLDPRQFALGVLWERMEEKLADDDTHDRVAQELKPLVVIPLRASVGQCPTQ